MKYRILHRSSYRYSAQAALSMNDACLLLRDTPFQTVQSSTLRADPSPDSQKDRRDWFGNRWRMLSLERPHTSFVLEAEHLVEVNREPGQGDGCRAGWEPFAAPSPQLRLSSGIADYARKSFSSNRDLFRSIDELNQRIFQDFTYDTGATTVTTSADEFFLLRRGVCQDYAHLMTAFLRELGIPARYVSGYLNTQPAPGTEKVWGADASHAWVSAWLPDRGWCDWDPTNGIAVGDHHIVLAWGRDYGDVSPLRGVVLGGGGQTLDVEVTVLTNSS